MWRAPAAKGVLPQSGFLMSQTTGGFLHLLDYVPENVCPLWRRKEENR